MPVRTCFTILSGREKVIFLIFFCLPFAQILGLAIPCGFIILYLALLLGFNIKGFGLPQFILKKSVSSKVIKKIIEKILKPLNKLKRLSKPRYTEICFNPAMKKVNSLVLASVGFFLAISMPIPFSSFIAFLTIFLIGVGVLNNDGLFIIIAYPIALFYIIFVILTLKFISLSEIFDWCRSLF